MTLPKPAQTDLDIHPLIKNRFSPRAFSPTPVEPQALERIVEAMRWAPSSYNDQPWRLYVGHKGDAHHTAIFDSLVEFNQNWAHAAPVLMLIASATISAKTGKPNAYHAYDTGAAATVLALQATAEGLYVHQMGGYDKSKLAKALSLPEDITPQAVIALGSLGEVEDLSADLQQPERAPRQRRPKDETVFFSA